MNVPSVNQGLGIIGVEEDRSVLVNRGWPHTTIQRATTTAAPDSCQPKRAGWTAAEDAELGQLVEKYGQRSWALIAKHLPGRIGKQCRERYHSHLNPDVRKGDWSEEEDKLIFSLREKFGNQWAMIARHVPGRTDNAVKNRWYSTMRRNERQAANSPRSKGNKAKSSACAAVRAPASKRGGPGDRNEAVISKKRVVSDDESDADFGRPPAKIVARASFSEPHGRNESFLGQLREAPLGQCASNPSTSKSPFTADNEAIKFLESEALQALSTLSNGDKGRVSQSPSPDLPKAATCEDAELSSKRRGKQLVEEAPPAMALQTVDGALLPQLLVPAQYSLQAPLFGGFCGIYAAHPSAVFFHPNLFPQRVIYVRDMVQPSPAEVSSSS